MGAYSNYGGFNSFGGMGMGMGFGGFGMYGLGGMNQDSMLMKLIRMMESITFLISSLS